VEGADDSSDRKWPGYEDEHDTWCDMPCPFGETGERLWVRETFIHEPVDYCWEASVSVPSQPSITIYRADAEDPRGGRWTPSIHMPRWASRITLEIKSVRVERLNEISEEDAIAEGVACERVVVDANCNGGVHTEVHADRYFHDADDQEGFEDGISAYAALWQSINGPGSWAANPWVWVVSFKRIEVQ
jgi:hypothetical protein